MKKLYFLILMAVTAITATAQSVGEAFYIYRNDGGFNAFFRDEVDSIAYSHYDLDSLYYDENVTQLVYTQDSLYRIPLAAIDSVNFVTPETVYKPGVKQIVGDLRNYVISSEQMSITFASNTPHSLLPRVGDKLVTLEMSEMFPIGFAGEVVDVQSGDNYVVQCDTTDLTSIFERYYSSSSLMMASDSDPNSARGPRRASFNERIPIPVFSRTFDVSAGVDVVDDLAFDLGASIGTTISTNCHVNCIFNIDWGKVYLKADVINDVTSTEDISVSGKVSLSKDFPIGVPFTYPIIPLVNFYAEAGSFVDFSAELCWGTSYTQRFHSEFHMLYDSQNPENNYRYGSNKHVGTDRDERVLTGGGTAHFGGYLEAGLNVVCKGLAKVGLRGELGVKGQLQATVHRSDFQDATRTTRLYDLLNADRSVTVGLFGGFRFVGGFWKFHTSVGVEGNIGGNLFEGGLVPRFSNLKAQRDVSQYGIAGVTSDLSRACLLPVKIGFQLLDENDSPLDRQFYSVNYQHENLSSFGMNFSGLATSKKYKVRPVVSLFDHELLASPSAEVDQSLQVVTHTPSDVEATKAILWGQVTGYDKQNDSGPVGFYYSSQGNPLTYGGQKLDAGMLAELANGIFSATLSDLEQNKKYYYIAAYQDNEGEMHYGEVQQFTTKEGETSCPVTLSDFKVTSKQHKENGFTHNGQSYDYCFNVSVTATLDDDAEGISEWGYVYLDPNGQEAFIPLSGHSYTDTRWAYFRSGTPPFTCTLYGYVKYVGSDEPVYGEPHDYPLEYGETTCPDANHPHAIDLGLPSGTKWACCNVGASAPEQYGGYYAWGETHEKSVYNWDTYQYGSSEDNVVNIGSDIAGTGYDAATANWGGPWRMPSMEHCRELISSCSSTWTIQNGVYVRKFIGPNGATIFLPAAGNHWESDLNNSGAGGYYWSSTITESDSGNAYRLYFNSEDVSMVSTHYYFGRSGGRSVRPVR